MTPARPPALSELRRAVSALEPGDALAATNRFRFGLPDLDGWLGGGLARGSLHEVYAERVADAAAAAGFGLGMAGRAAGERPLVWTRQDLVSLETGQIHGAGLAAFGLDPACLILVRARDPTAALRAVAEAARCAAIGAAIMEIWGEPKVLDLKASRRLALAASASGVTLVMIRLQAEPAPSAAASRWSVASTASVPLEANAPGRPAFKITLLRHRAGLSRRSWRVEWDRDSAAFALASLPCPVVSVPAHRPVAAQDAALLRRAG
ncbi:ImuA family protein [Methylobacterium gnaphalii]|uniref:Protein ImuA n=1 Tax=Methylobacterium gnaphalii TaxID=1010610 RepID=A0A512JIW5_9HYPH|nr:hypothetical protein [Methylobacterium gnaphalii]GEP09908.1 hypothetical protein MGN01_17530 [Methylobacterium gnaphalii]GJD68317.1 hypothetical protein MMMDOFMJ_1238 [Methylobacterium gnaphalii]GLS49937.1 hypothetical protein GCM10007885_27890 [Methylobacterium gnaphalii]